MDQTTTRCQMQPGEAKDSNIIPRHVILICGITISRDMVEYPGVSGPGWSVLSTLSVEGTFGGGAPYLVLGRRRESWENSPLDSDLRDDKGYTGKAGEKGNVLGGGTSMHSEPGARGAKMASISAEQEQSVRVENMGRSAGPGPQAQRALAPGGWTVTPREVGTAH